MTKTLVIVLFAKSQLWAGNHHQIRRRVFFLPCLCLDFCVLVIVVQCPALFCLRDLTFILISKICCFPGFFMFVTKSKYAWDDHKEVVCVLLLCVWGFVYLCYDRNILNHRVLMKWTGCVCYCVLLLCVCYFLTVSLEERCSTTSCWHMGRGIWAGWGGVIGPAFV